MKINFELVNYQNALPLCVNVHSTINYELHWHREIELLLVLQGSIRVQIGDKTYTFGEGQICVVNSREIHSTYSDDRDCIVIVMQLDMDYCNSSYAKFDCIKFENSTTNDVTEIRKYMSKIVMELNKKREGYASLVSSYIKIIVVALVNTYNNEKIQGKDRVSSSDIDMLQQITTYINDNYKNQITLKSVADEFSFSHYYLSHYFKDKLGITFIDYVNNLKINSAVTQLVDTNDSMVKIAMDNGFPSSKSFGSLFKKRYGVTPQKYRQGNEDNKIATTGNHIYTYVSQSDTLKKLIVYADEESKTPHREVVKTDNVKKVDVEYIKINTDVDNSIIFKKYWQKTMTFGRAYDMLRFDAMEHIRDMQNKIGFELIRFHGIFSEEMRVVNVIDNEIVYTWTYVHKVLDFLLSVGVKPFLDMTFTPLIMATKDITIMNYKGNVSLPEINKWKEMLNSFLSSCIDRYGIVEVSSWYYEVLNEPDVMYDCTMGEYVQFFVETYKVFTRFIDDVKLVGPSSMCGNTVEANEFLVTFINELREYNMRLEYCSVHIYGESFVNIKLANVDNLLNRSFRLENKGSQSKTIDKLANIKNEFDIKEMHVTEWNYSGMQISSILDTAYMSAFIVYTAINNIGKITSLGYWVCSDIFEENYVFNSPFHGGFGLINYDGIRKASFYAFWLLSKLGTEVVDCNENYLVTTNSNKSEYQIIMCNLAEFDAFYSNGDRSKSKKEPYRVFEECKQREFNINFNNIQGKYVMDSYEINRNSGSAYDVWVAQGRKDNLKPDEVQYIKEKSIPKHDRREVYIQDEIKCVVPAHGVVLITLRSV